MTELDGFYPVMEGWMRAEPAGEVGMGYMVRAQREGSGRSWGVYKGWELVEGGFFERASAETARDEWEKNDREDTRGGWLRNPEAGITHAEADRRGDVHGMAGAFMEDEDDAD